MKCGICKSSIHEMKYAIRDMIPEETYKKWVYRHIKSFLYFGFKGRKFATIIPICKVCVTKIKGEKL